MRETASWRVDMIISVYQPGQMFNGLLEILKQQTYPIGKIIIVNTDKSYWSDGGYQGIPGLEIHHIMKAEFDHGGTRNPGAGCSDTDIMVSLADDAVPKDEHLIERLVETLSWTGDDGETVAVAYARQFLTADCRYIERYTRPFNYPGESRVKTASSLPELGIRTCIASNVYCTYQRDIFLKPDGFITRTIFNEDMIYATNAVKAGYGIAYAAEARVVHPHSLPGGQQLHRNPDLAISQADHPEIFEGIPSEGESIRLMKQAVSYPVKIGHFWLLPSLVYGGDCEYAGYWLGKYYRRLPSRLVRRYIMSQDYWNRKKVEGK